MIYAVKYLLAGKDFNDNKNWLFMINYIWIFFILSSFVVAIFTGRIGEVSSAIMLSAKSAVTIAISLIGVMAFWLGMVKIAEKSGLMDVIAKIIRPVTEFLFPEIPKDNQAIGNIATSFAANALGITNAATPIGIKAMQKMQEINPEKETASNPMCMFLAINTAGFQLIPASAMAVLAAVGCKNPTIIILPTLIATSTALVGAIFSAKIFEYFASKTHPPKTQKTQGEQTLAAIGGSPDGN